MFSFLHRNQILVSSVLCLLFSLYILASAARGTLKADPIGPILLGLMRPLQIGVQATVIKLREFRQGFSIFRDNARENEKLRERILDLESDRNQLLEAQATNRRLRELLEFRSQLPSGSVTAAVIGNSASTWFRSLTLDMGSAAGVHKGMTAVTPLGVVGQVIAVTSKSSRVLLLTDPNSGVDVIGQRSRARGIVSGSLDSEPTMKYVKRNEDIQEGDQLITSGLGGVYPKGLLVGTVVNVHKKNFGLFQYLGVSLAADPLQVEEVLLVSTEAAKFKK